MKRRFYQLLAKTFRRLYWHFENETKETSLFQPYILDIQSSNIEKPCIVHVNGNFTVGGTSQLMVDIIERTSDQYVHKVVVPELPNPIPYQPVDIYEFTLYQIDGLYKFLLKEQPLYVHIQYWIRENDEFHPLAIWYRYVFEVCNSLKIRVIQNVNVPTKPFVNPSIIHNVYVSKYVQDEFGREDQTNASVIYPGSNFKHFLKKQDTVTPVNTIGMVYRLDPDKLNEASIEPFIIAVKKRNNITCYIVGGGTYLEYYKQRVKEEGVESNFIFTGFVSYKELPDYYRKLNIFVAPVHNESFGQVTPFAMNMGLNIAGYKIGALSEILGTEKTLVQPGDADALSNTILELLNDDTERKRLSEQNMKRANNLFSVETMIDNYLNLYNKYR